MLQLVIMEIESIDNRNFMEELYQISHRLMYHIAKKWTDSENEQEDIVQDALVKLLPKIDLLRSMERPRQISYIAHTVRNTAITHLDRKAREEKWVTAVDFGGTENLLSSPILSPEDTLLQGEWRELFRQIWSQLPEREKLLLEGKYVFHVSDKELAQCLGCRPASVRMALTRAKRMVIEELERRQNSESSGTITGAV